VREIEIAIFKLEGKSVDRQNTVIDMPDRLDVDRS
jgi:hypothetical protein